MSEYKNNNISYYFNTYMCGGRLTKVTSQY